MSTHDATVHKEKFSALYTSYARAYERFLENGFKTSTVILIVLGWLLSSESARAFLQMHKSVLILFIGLIVMGSISLCLTFHRLSRLSQLLRIRLDELAFIESDFYDQHRIVPLIYWSVIGQNALACALIVTILVWLAL